MISSFVVTLYECYSMLSFSIYPVDYILSATSSSFMDLKGKSVNTHLISKVDMQFVCYTCFFFFF